MINPNQPSERAGVGLLEVPGYQIKKCLSDNVAFKRLRARSLLDASPIILEALSQPYSTKKNYLAQLS